MAATHHNAVTPYMDTPQKHSELFPEIGEDRMAFPATSVDPKAVAAEVYKDKLVKPGPIQLRVNRYFKQVPDFERDDAGNVKFHSLRGPAKIAAREQFVREKMVAIEECKMVREAMEDCYKREGVDSRTNCKHLVKAYSALIESPYWGMLKVSPRVPAQHCPRSHCSLRLARTSQAPSKY